MEHEEARPDLTIHDSDGRARVFVENKFWAGLTDAQPVSYLSCLPKVPPSALVFIVPEQRVSTVWNELMARCSDAGLEWDGCGRQSRRDLSASLQDYADRQLEPRSGNCWMLPVPGDTTRSRLISSNLQALTDLTDSEAFLPLRDDEVTDQETARRLMNYIGLIDGVVYKLVDDGIADTNGLYVLCYFRLYPSLFPHARQI